MVDTVPTEPDDGEKRGLTMATTFKQGNLVKLMVALGHKAAGSWSVEKLGEKVSAAIPKVDKATATELDPKRKVTFDKIQKVLAADGDWGIEESEAVETAAPAPKKKTGKTSKDNTGVGTGHGPKEKVGVTSYVFDLLRAATKDKPLKIEKALEKVVAKFGPKTEHKRPIKGLRTTLYAQVAFQLKNYKGWDVRTTGDRGNRGFYIHGTKPNPALIPKKYLKKKKKK